MMVLFVRIVAKLKWMGSMHVLMVAKRKVHIMVGSQFNMQIPFVHDPAQPVGHPARADDGPADVLPACINDDAAVPRGGPAGQPASTDDVAATQHVGNNGGQAKPDGQHNRTNGDPTTQPEPTGGSSGVARGGRGGHLPPGAARRVAPKSCQRIFQNLYKEKLKKF